MTRRELIAVSGGALCAAAAAPIPIIDTHIHLFDPTRPQGIPWPPKTNEKLYKPALPERYRKLTAGLGIKGAIKVEASPWLEDNQWVLDVAAKDTIIVGVVGNLEAGKPDFRKNLDRFAKNKLFLGIRYGNLWDRKFSADVQRPEFIADIKALAAAGLTMDTANPNPALIADLVKLTNKVPELRLVIDHLPQLNPPTEAAAKKAYEADLRELGKNPKVFVKISEVLRRVDGKVPLDMPFYRERIDSLVGVFGEDRVLFGSDWPNSDNWADYPQVLAVVREYFTAKGQTAAEKYFWKNSKAAYRWTKRDPGQPG
ncbi:MAG: amidohydrolase family protein [Bryobacteraceae bacterium]